MMQACKFMFRIDSNTKLTKVLWKTLEQIAYRLIVCFENKDKRGEQCKDHFHGFIEMDGTKTNKQNYDRLNRLLAKYTELPKSQKAITTIGEDALDEKKTMCYVVKQGNIITEYNTSFDIESLANWYKGYKKDEATNNSLKRKAKQEEFCDTFFETMPIGSNLDEIKWFVAKELMNNGNLPIVSKVRAYAMYIIHKLDLEINKSDLYKLL